ncbi:MAG TPA: hypothetical protein VFD70_18630 [Anaerolineae bacterium]|nr:hypothetical protein [Anaerolineae bacterium]
MAEKRLAYAQHGLEATPGTAVPATFKWLGDAMSEFLDAIATPKRDSPGGVFGGIIEGAFVPETGTEIVLPDTPFSFEYMVWVLNHSVKSNVGPLTTFPFPLPTTTPNTIKTFTYEYVTRTQSYQVPYCFIPEWEVHGDVNNDNGKVLLNGRVRGRKAVPASPTAGLGYIPSLDFANVNNSTIHFDSLGTAAGSAAARTGFMKGFSINNKTGWNEGRYGDGRPAADFAVHEFSDYEISGTVKALFNANAATELANARAGSGRIMAIKINGNTSRVMVCKLPIIFDKAPKLGDEENGLVLVTFPWHAGYSETATAQPPQFDVTLSGATTVT